MSDSDNDLPDLVESSDEEAIVPQKGYSDFADAWLSKPDKFLKKQEHLMKIFILGPFLFAINKSSRHWLDAVRKVGLMTNNERERDCFGGLDWREWELVDLMEEIIEVVFKKMRKKMILVKVLGIIEQVDAWVSAPCIEIEDAIAEGEKLQEICDIMTKIMKNTELKDKEKQAKFGVLYAMHFYTQCVIMLGKNGKDYLEEQKKLQKHQSLSPEEMKNEGNKFFLMGQYDKAIESYTKAIINDRLNHVYFGNRCQAFIKFGLFREALSDGRRSVVLKPDWPKGHYRYASACALLGRLELAIVLNARGLQLCKDVRKEDSNYQQLEAQGQKFANDKRERSLKHTVLSMPKDLADVLNDIPNPKNNSSVWGVHEFEITVHEKTDLISLESDEETSKILNAEKRKLQKTSGKEKKYTTFQKTTDAEIVTKLDSSESAKTKSAPVETNLEPLSVVKTEVKTADSNQTPTVKTPDSNQTSTVKTSDSNQTPTVKTSDSNQTSAVKTSDSELPPAEKTEAKSTNSKLPHAMKTESKTTGPKSVSISNTGLKAAEARSPPIMKAEVETSKEPEKQNALPLKDLQQKQELEMYMSQGSDALRKNLAKNAVAFYSKALDLVSRHPLEQLGIDEVDLVTLKYAFGIAAVSTGTQKLIMEGIDKFSDIIRVHQEVRFPMAYHGLAKGYVRLNRFPEALSPLKDGITITNNISINPVTWPGTTDFIEESNQDKLKTSLEELLHLCRYPPKPDALCRIHTDEEEDRLNIYFSDPDFKGFVRLFCELRCYIELHPNCWKNYKSKLNKTGDKEVLDTACPTPNCQSTIVRIQLIRPDSLCKEHISDKINNHKEKKPAPNRLMKTKAISEEKLRKRQEYKEERKQRHRELHEEKENLIEETEEKLVEDLKDKSESAQTLAQASVPVQNDNSLNVQSQSSHLSKIVLKKDEPVIQTYKVSNKSKKNKKKKEKNKQVLNLEVNFSDRREENLLNENSVLSDDENKSRSVQRPNHKNPFLVPHSLRNQVEDFEQSYTGGGENDPFRPDEITKNLFSYFEDLFKLHGPLLLTDPQITRELDLFPTEAQNRIKQVGGLCKFLQQSLKFAVIDDVLSLMKDAVKCREIAIKRRQEKVKEGSEGFIDGEMNAWKKVGRFNGEIDTLKTSTDFPSLNLAAYSSVSNSHLSNYLTNPGNAISLSVGSKKVTQSSSNGNLKEKTNKTRESYDSLDDFSFPVARSGLRMQNNSGIDSLDSIDDFPVMQSEQKKKKKKTMDDLDDFDLCSESSSDGMHSDMEEINLGHISAAKLKSRSPFEQVRDGSIISRSSSRSSTSEKSDRSSESGFRQPRPTPYSVPSYSFKTLPFGTKLNTELEQSVLQQQYENSFTLHDTGMDTNVFASPQYSTSSNSDLSAEIRQATEDFRHKSDSELVAELADSVVDKMFSGTSASVQERKETYKRVIEDIWNDFKRSDANTSAKMESDKYSSRSWSNSWDVSSRYGKNRGEYAEELMKRHYRKTKQTTNFTFPSTSGYNINVSDSSILSPVWSINDDTNIPDSFSSSTIPVTSENITSVTSNYSLFAGPSLGMNSSPFLSSLPSTYPHTSSIPSRTPGFPPTPLPMPTPRKTYVDKEIETEPLQQQSIETMTEPYEPNKMELIQVRERHNQTLQELQRMVKACQDLENENKMLKQEVSRQRSETDVLLSNFDRERNSFEEEIQQLKQHLNRKKATEQELHNLLLEKEKTINNVSEQSNQQREKDLQNMKKYYEATKKYEAAAENEKKRATDAEIEVLKLRLQNYIQSQEKVLKEASFHQHHMSNYLKKQQEENNTVPVQLAGNVKHLISVMEKCQENISQVEEEIEEQLRQVNAGVKLNDLPEIYLPPPPSPSEAIKAIPSNVLSHPTPRLKHTQGQTSMLSLPGPPGLSVHDGTTVHMNNSATPLTSNAIGTINSADSKTNSITIKNSKAVSSSEAALQTVAMIKPLTSDPPRPLAPPQVIPGLMPPRPIGSIRHHFAPPALRASTAMNIATPGVSTQPPKNNFERLIDKLQTVFPSYNRSEFTRLIQELRQNRGGSLSGMTIEDIIHQISEIIKSRSDRNSAASLSAITYSSQGENTRSTRVSSQQPVPLRPLAPPPGLPASWAFQSGDKPTNLGEREYFEEEDPCVICHEEMTLQEPITLECGHKFHDQITYDGKTWQLTIIAGFAWRNFRDPNLSVHNVITSNVDPNLPVYYVITSHVDPNLPVHYVITSNVDPNLPVHYVITSHVDPNLPVHYVITSHVDPNLPVYYVITSHVDPNLPVHYVLTSDVDPNLSVHYVITSHVDPNLPVYYVITSHVDPNLPVHYVLTSDVDPNLSVHYVITSDVDPNLSVHYVITSNVDPNLSVHYVITSNVNPNLPIHYVITNHVDPNLSVHNAITSNVDPNLPVYYVITSHVDPNLPVHYVITSNVDPNLPVHYVITSHVDPNLPVHYVITSHVDPNLPVYVITSHVDTNLPVHYVITSHVDPNLPVHYVITSNVDTNLPVHYVITSHVDPNLPVHYVITSHVDPNLPIHYVITSHVDPNLSVYVITSHVDPNLPVYYVWTDQGRCCLHLVSAVKCMQ
ncbi:hypothetical protein ACJMK2_026830 [Sinanodonta woodiana]|uniref:RING-type E3 ubiquitin transferase n=1 Tax=Sinanodonta woodiana TaxID=1069815 RepID=A0ABD3XKU4_SINWO